MKNRMKFKIEYLLLFLFIFPFFLILPVENNQKEIQDSKEQISQVADVVEETTLTTTDKEEFNQLIQEIQFNQLIQEIQKNNKQIIKNRY